LLESLEGETLPPDAFEVVRDQHFIGPPDEVVAKVQAFVDAGARHLVMMFLDADRCDDSAARFMSDVVPALRA
jgi:alkanesulfonate monooxygenase SsuD/methylene tetrahydromethanopterin reductase-like flavin-dependent oxidoreductase (luciferase family)